MQRDDPTFGSSRSSLKRIRAARLCYGETVPKPRSKPGSKATQHETPSSAPANLATRLVATQTPSRDQSEYGKTRRSSKKSTSDTTPPAQDLSVQVPSRGKDVTRVPHTVFCCQASACSRNGARPVWKSLRHQVRRQSLKSDVQMVKTHCTGLCKHGPILIVCAAHSAAGEGVVWYSGVQTEDAALIAHEHLANNRIVESRRHGHRENTIAKSAASTADKASGETATPAATQPRDSDG